MDEETPGMDTPEFETPDLGDTPALSQTPGLGEYEYDMEGAVNSQARIAVVGDPNVGKTCLLMSYRPAVKDEIPSIFNAIHIEKDINLYGHDQPLLLTLCDTGSAPQYLHLRQKAYKNVDIILVCFDVMNMASLQSIDTHWMQEIKEFAPHAFLSLIGLKSDKRSKESEHENEVSPEIINNYIERYNFIDYIETSALKKYNVDIAFEIGIQEFIGSNAKHRKTTSVRPEETPDIDPEDIVGTHQYQWGQHLKAIEQDGDVFAALTHNEPYIEAIEPDPHSMNHMRPLVGSHLGPQSMLNNGSHLMVGSAFQQQHPMSWSGPQSMLGSYNQQQQFPPPQQQFPSQQTPSPAPHQPFPHHRQQQQSYAPLGQQAPSVVIHPQQQYTHDHSRKHSPHPQYSPHAQQQYSPNGQQQFRGYPPTQQQQHSPRPIQQQQQGQNYIHQEPLRQGGAMQLPHIVPNTPTPPPPEQKQLKTGNGKGSVQYSVRKHVSTERTGSIDYALGKESTSEENGSCQCCVVM